MEIYELIYEGNIYAIPVSRESIYFFEKKHGKGSLLRMLRLLANDCNTFSSIANQFGLTRERVRQIYKRKLSLHLS